VIRDDVWGGWGCKMLGVIARVLGWTPLTKLLTNDGDVPHGHLV